jgi:Bacterial Ig-like domain (group 3)/Cep192 domain 4
MKASRLVLFFACIASLTAINNHDLSEAQIGHQTLRSNKGQTSAAKNNSRADLARAAVAQLPLFFEANQGQTDGRVRFLARSGGYTLFLTPTETVLAESSNVDEDGRGRFVKAANATKSRAVLRMKLAGANPAPMLTGVDELPGKVNYLIGNDPHAWHTGVPLYSQVRSEQVYPGIDLVFHGDDRQLEYDFVVAPGADPNRVALHITGAKRIDLNPQGDLVLHAPDSEVLMRRPVIYQTIAGERRPVAGNFVLRATKEVGFQIASYDRSQPLVIDPTISYATFLGGAGQDQGGGIALDNITNPSAPKLYVPGVTTDITTFPESHTLLGSSGAGAYIFLAKIDPTLTGAASLDFLTFIGGHTPFSGTGTCTNLQAYIGLDTSQGASNVEAVLSGRTDCSDYPVTTGSHTTGTNDLVLTRLTPSGALDLSIFFGGNGEEHGGSILLDPSGNVVLSSDTTSTDLPFTASAYATKLNNGATGGVEDCFVAKLSRSFVVEYLTYLNVGIGTTAPGQLGCGAGDDSSGKIIAGGDTASPTAFNAAGGANGFQTTYQGTATKTPLADTFLMRLDPTRSGTSQLIYATYLGGGGFTTPDAGTLLLSTGVVAVAGNTVSGTSTNPGNIPLKNAFQNTNLSDPTSGKGTGFVAVVDTTKTGAASLIFSSYFGGTGGDGKVQSIAYDPITGSTSSYRLVLGGQTGSTAFPLLNALQSSLVGSQNAFVSVLDVPSSSAGPAGTLLFSIGGGVTSSGQSETVQGVVTDPSHKIYARARTLSDSFFGHTSPATTVNGFQTTCSSCSPTHASPADDTAVFAIANPAQTQASSTTLVSSLNPSTVGQAVTFTATVKPASIGTPTGSVTFKDGTTTLGTSALSSGIAKFTTSTLPVGTHSITAVYGGDATFLSSTSAALSQVVNTGTGTPAVTFTPTSLSFTQQLVGAKSAAKPVTLKNSGTGALTISSIVAVGNFSQTNNCPASLASGLTCTISVSFTPSITGKVLGEVTVTDNAPGTTQEIGLSGNGVTPLNFSPT